MKKQTNSLLVVLCLFGITVFLNGCQVKEGEPISESQTRSEQLSYYSDVFWSDKLEDLNDEDREEALFSFIRSLSVEELKFFYKVGFDKSKEKLHRGTSAEEKQKAVDNMINIHKESLELRGKNAFNLTEKQMDFLNFNKHNRQARSSCYSYNFPIPCGKSNSANWNCIATENVTYPGDNDCDYGLIFYVGPMSPTATLNLRGTTFRARFVLNTGGINSRHFNLKREILVGKGRTNLVYWNGVDGLKSDIKAGL